MSPDLVRDSHRLKLAVLGDFDGPHTRAWVRWFILRGHDVHAISFYPPSEPLVGATVHALRQRATPNSASGAPPAAAARRGPRSLMRLLHAARYWRSGLKDVLRAIAPDVFHAHFVVEHGFYGSFAGFHPLVVTAWGSDVLVEPERDPLSRQIAKWTFKRADLITSNNAVMADRIAELGAARSKVEIVTLGTDASFGELWHSSPNVSGATGDTISILSTRAHEPLYNIGTIIEAFGLMRAKVPRVRLVVAHSGSLTPALRAQARSLGDAVTFTGTVDAERLRALMTEASVFVSMPSSDGTSVALLQAMSAGAFPVVSDLDTVREWVTDGENGIVVPIGAPVALAEALVMACGDAALRKRAAIENREAVQRRGTNETQMARMEELYLRLAGRS
jgi:glycosyltransferase involved in cell wall biosynthesis